jgi:hypothetical protein
MYSACGAMVACLPSKPRLTWYYLDDSMRSGFDSQRAHKTLKPLSENIFVFWHHVMTVHRKVDMPMRVSGALGGR